MWGADNTARFVALCDMSAVGILVRILQCTAKAERAERNYRQSFRSLDEHLASSRTGRRPLQEVASSSIYTVVGKYA